MSLLKAIKAQLGLSNTPANNFTITAEADNGTLKLARGNAGATTQDILTVDASGNVLVDGNNLNLFSAKSLASSGYQKLPSGLIVQWGLASFAGGGSNTFTFPVTFPHSCFAVVSNQNYSGSGLSGNNVTSAYVVSASQFALSMPAATGAATIFWFAIGY